jgi:Holliday junction resolvase RusA-like endonuclease
MTEPFSIRNEMIAFSIPGEAIPFARAGSNGKRRFTPPKQANFMDVVKLFAQRAMEGTAPLEGPLRMQVRATYLVPVSWSKKKQASATWKSTKPDADNITKILKDSLNKIVWQDDAQVADLHVQKKFGPIASVTVCVSRLESKIGE